MKYHTSYWVRLSKCSLNAPSPRKSFGRISSKILVVARSLVFMNTFRVLFPVLCMIGPCLLCVRRAENTGSESRFSRVKTNCHLTPNHVPKKWLSIVVIFHTCDNSILTSELQLLSSRFRVTLRQSQDLEGRYFYAKRQFHCKKAQWNSHRT